LKLTELSLLFRDSKTIARTLIKRSRATKGRRKLFFTADQTRQAVEHLHPEGIRWQVTKVREETATTKTLVLTPSSGRVPAFLPGQYVNVIVKVGDINTSRPQSISSPPDLQGVIEITVKESRAGFVSRYLVREVSVGDEIMTSGPEGDFYYSPVRDRNHLLLIAGGSGITPFMGMSEYVLEHYPAVCITLLYGSSDAADIIFQERIGRLAQRYPNRFSPVLLISEGVVDWPDEPGVIDRHVIRRHVDPAQLAHISVFVCGPRRMQEYIVQELASLGVARHRIQIEASSIADGITDFEGWPPAVRADTQFAVTLAGQRAPVQAAAGESLANSLERAGLSVPVLCRMGVCGSCRCKLRRGSVFTDPMAMVRPADHKSGFVLLCVSYPLSELELALAANAK
jgi:glycine betaine catabolism B